MKSQTIVLLVATIVICLAAHGLSVGSRTNSRCKCVSVHSRFISPKYYQHIDIFPKGSFCRRLEILITLKNGKYVCVNPQTQWVKRVISLLTETQNSLHLIQRHHQLNEYDVFLHKTKVYCLLSQYFAV
ncbi:interleukin-8-like [Scyliorhinus canicula]|uniref:interleukin-8-like n=1 Tax=Scyliorhinus canicula TaxID=7830 RepID=UPI0018F798AE|nr:interleukin-8-like [Scyliorhinus canicula]